MRHIYNLPEDKLPRNAEFKFKERAKTLVEKWHDILNASKSNGEGTVRKPAANGKAHSEEAGAKEDKEKSPSQEPPAKALSDAMDIDTKELDAEKDEEKEKMKVKLLVISYDIVSDLRLVKFRDPLMAAVVVS